MPRCIRTREPDGGSWPMSFDPQWFPVLVGVVVGLVWTAAKVSIPLLVRGRDRQRHRHRRRAMRCARGRSSSPSSASCRAPSPACAGGGPSGSRAGRRRRCATGCSPTSNGCTSRTTTRPQTGNLMSRANTDLNQIQQFLVMIPLTLSNAVTVARRHRHPAHDRPGAHAAGARQPAAAQRARQAVRRPAAPGRHGHPARVGRRRRGRRGDGVGRARREGLRRRAGAAGPVPRRGRRRSTTSRSSATRVRSVFLPALELLPNIGLILVLAYGGHQVHQRQPEPRLRSSRSTSTS